MTQRDLPDAGRDTLEALVRGDDEGRLTFDAPWQARAFGLALALRDRGALDWDAFQAAFIDRIQSVDEARLQADVEAVYYECWLETLEDALVEAGLVEPSRVDRRAREFTEGVRDSGEFVVR